MELDQPCALLAQSMGGIVAIQAVMKRPERITHLVLAATSGGIDMADFEVADWRPDNIEVNPTFPDWFANYDKDLTPDLTRITIPTLLLWGDRDPISPIGVGMRLSELLRRSHLHIGPGGEHDFVNKFSPIVSPLIEAHLSAI